PDTFAFATSRTRTGRPTCGIPPGPERLVPSREGESLARGVPHTVLFAEVRIRSGLVPAPVDTGAYGATLPGRLGSAAPASHVVPVVHTPQNLILTEHARDTPRHAPCHLARRPLRATGRRPD